MIFSKSNEVIDLVSSYSDKVILCYERFMEILEDMLRGCLYEDKEKYALEISRLESEADKIRHEIIRKLFEGRMLVDSRKSIARLIEGVDKVANLCEDIIQLIYFQNIDGLSEYSEDINAINRITHKQLIELINTIKSLVTKYQMNEMLESIVKIETYESEVDVLEQNIVKSIFKSNLDLAQKNQYRELISNIGSLSDIIEDLSDEIEIIMMSRNI